jgi:LPS-assembly lipoprotein
MKPALLLSFLLALAGCALHPLYQNAGGGGSVLPADFGVQVAGLEGKTGWLVHNALEDRLGHKENQVVRYRLELELDDKITGAGSTRNANITREQRVLRARWRLMDLRTGAKLLDAAASADESWSVGTSEYGTLAAENVSLERLAQSLADQIVARIAVYSHAHSPQAHEGAQ